MSIYVTDAAGNRTKIAGVGLPGPAGKSAYQYAVEGGFTGTEDEFKALMGVRSNPNLLDNWYFADPINQRGKTVKNGEGYFFDRWTNLDGGNTKSELKNGYVTLSCISSDLHKGLFQLIENYQWLKGDVVTFSVLYRTDYEHTSLAMFFGGSDNGLFSPRLSPSSVWNIASFTRVVPITDDVDQLRVSFNIAPGFPEETIDVIAAKLELGPVQTLAHKDASGNWVLNDPPPNKALELAKFQRYYEQTALPSGNTLLRIYNHFDVPHSLAELNARIDFLTEKRIAPVVLIGYDINDGEAQTMFAQYPDRYGFTDNILQIPSNSWIDINSYSANADL